MHPRESTGLSPMKSHFKSGVWHQVSSSKQSWINTHISPISRAAGNFIHTDYILLHRQGDPLWKRGPCKRTRNRGSTLKFKDLALLSLFFTSHVRLCQTASPFLTAPLGLRKPLFKKELSSISRSNISVFTAITYHSLHQLIYQRWHSNCIR